MKKIKPWTGQKAWEEKQAKVAAQADGKSSSGNPFIDLLNSHYEKIKNDQFILGQDKLLIPTMTVPKDKLSAQFPPDINIPAKTFPVLGSGFSPPKTNDPQPPFIIYDDFSTDQYDKYLFGGEDGERDYKLPQGIGQYTYGDWVNGSDPAFKQEERCCKPEDKVNIGFMQDKWACKICGKDM